MKCIVGLGNPGKKYHHTRHNIGFMVIDELLSRHHWSLNKSKFNGKYALEHDLGEKIIFLKPQTYMNLSGECLYPLMKYYHIDIDDILVIYDDLDLPVGKIRLRQKGGHGGHNGIRSIIDHLGTKDFKRIRIGVGRPTNSMPIVDYVLSTFPKAKQEDVHESIKKSADACEAWLKAPFNEVMNEFNH
ncbi:aminoacyl-tRNA hydrolase [Virgibacillus alimentarius]|uniref:Peptidyl-tRNA hydrolase n=1 Tax=Virgibacillus alimentarius TaxID=698769 RepID=A0ABS4S6J8_9BACI|nr:MULTISPECIES: aminoacyl-tRNA hydrolase [Virgibacillus]MBP2257130.1 PTH1 family peptidyl-tRNA hydrolase [Virgibacillus alimentarius]HLR66661.1 aminoacyl-tRNA hydrolase [Virgibacillus sp.]